MQVVFTKWKTVLQSSLKSICQGEVIVGNHLIQAPSGILTLKKKKIVGAQCVEFYYNFIVKKLGDGLVMVSQYICEGREGTERAKL